MPVRKTSAPSDLLINTMVDWLRPQTAMNRRMAMKSGQTVNRLKMRVARNRLKIWVTRILTTTVTTMQQEKTFLRIIHRQIRAETKAKSRPWTWLENEHLWFACLFLGRKAMAGEESKEDAGEFPEWEGFSDDDDEVSEWDGFSDNDDGATDVQLSLPFPLKVVTLIPLAKTRA